MESIKKKNPMVNFPIHICRDSIRDDLKMILDSYIKRALTISFVEREFEGLGLGHWSVDNHGVHTKVNHVRIEKSFSLIRSGRLWFLAFFPSLFSGWLISPFILYSPSWLILALHSLVRQVLTSVPVPSAVPSYFLLVARIEVTSSKRLFSLT